MGLFEKLFPRRPPDADPRAYFKTLTAYQPVYTTYRGGLYEMALTRAAIAAFARHCSKLHLEIVGGFRPELAPVLGQQPNPWMDASKFIARLATIYQVQNNAFIVPVEDAAGRLVGYYPVLPQQTSIREYGGAPYLQYEGDTGAQGPKGDTGETGPQGATGATPNLQIGEVTTLDAGSDATASITGTPENPLLNLGIPKGADGAGGGETWVKIGDYTWSAEDAAAENVPNIFFTQDVEGNPLSFDAVIVECEPLCAANRIMYMLFPDKDNLNQNKNYVFAGSNMLRNGQHEFVRVDLYSSPTPHAISHCNLSGNCKQNGGTQGEIVVWEPVVTSDFIYPANAVRIFPSGQLLEGSKFTVWGRKVNV